MSEENKKERSRKISEGNKGKTKNSRAYWKNKTKNDWTKTRNTSKAKNECS